MGNSLMKTNVPEELIVEVLLKLPIKSLLRCRCVSKSWYNLIKNPNFINTHLLKNKNHNHIILTRQQFDSTTSLTFHDYESLDVISPDLELPLIHTNNLDVCGPCNGLICVTDRLNDIVLCNPSMREFKMVSPVQYTCRVGYDTNVTSIGLGFDSVTNAYKVVCFIDLSPNDNHPWYNVKEKRNPKAVYIVPSEIVCVVYNLGTDTWREIDHKQGSGLRYIQPIPSGMLLDGVFYWIAVGSGGDSGGNSRFILHFDMITEVFGCMRLPYMSADGEKCWKLAVLNDSLALFSYTNPWLYHEQQFVEIWVMNQKGAAESWTQQFTIGPVMGIERPLLVWKNEAILLEGSAEAKLVSLVSCALDTGEMVAYEIQGFQETFKVFVSQESLVSIKYVECITLHIGPFSSLDEAYPIYALFSAGGDIFDWFEVCQFWIS